MTQITEEQKQILTGIAAANIRPQRAPVLGTPGDYGLNYEDVFFPSKDGVPLEAWFIPCQGSDKLIICNHPATMSRTGYPGDMAPWNAFNPTKVNFHPEYLALHAAGYNILTYDMRNHGNSGQGNDGVTGIGQYEWRDVIGAFDYVNRHETMQHMALGLLNRCMGGVSAIVAMSKMPEYFKDVKAFVCPQPASMDLCMPKILSTFGLCEPAHWTFLEAEQRRLGGFTNQEMRFHPYVGNVEIPTYILQVKEDTWSPTDQDVQVTYDLLKLSAEDKKLLWIEGTTQRFDGYNYLGKQPQSMIAWFDKYMK